MSASSLSRRSSYLGRQRLRTILPPAALATPLRALEESLAAALAVSARGGPPRQLLGDRDGPGGGRPGRRLVLVNGYGEGGSDASGDGGDAEGLQSRQGPGVDVDSCHLRVGGRARALGVLRRRLMLPRRRNGAVDGHAEGGAAGRVQVAQLSLKRGRGRWGRQGTRDAQGGRWPTRPLC